MLSLQEHVARRSVERCYRDRERAVATWEDLCVDVDAGVAPLFSSGRRLRDGDVPRLAGAALAAFERLDPLAVLDHVRPATRGRPRSEEREVLCVSPHAGEADGRRHVELCSARIWLSRKRAVIESASTLARVTTHAMARAIERGVVEDGEGIDRRAARCLLDHAGLVVLGRALLGAGDLDWADTFAIPFDEGLVLGAFHPSGESGRDRLVYDADGRFPHAPPPSDLVTDTPGRPGGKPCAYRGSTILGVGELTPAQFGLHAALTDLVRRHRAVVNALGEACLWPETAIRAIHGGIVGGEAWREALDALRVLVGDPELRMRDGGRPRRLARPALPPGIAALAQGPLARAASERSSSMDSSALGAAAPSTST